MICISRGLGLARIFRAPAKYCSVRDNLINVPVAYYSQDRNDDADDDKPSEEGAAGANKTTKDEESSSSEINNKGPIKPKRFDIGKGMTNILKTGN